MKKRIKKVMVSVDFPEVNHLFKPIDKRRNYELPVWRGEVDSGKGNSSARVISCWRVPFWQRVLMVFHGTIWLETLGRGQTPVALHCKRQVFTKGKG